MLLRNIFIFSLFCNCISAQIVTTSVPENIDPKGLYILYLHGKIIEDQGVNAVSQDYDVYEYHAILDTFKTAGFNVISEVRQKNTDYKTYAKKVVRQIDSLLKAGVPPGNVTVLGASKGGWITILVSSELKNRNVNFVIMGICGEDMNSSLDVFKVCGNILSVYERSDSLGTSCQKLFLPARACLGKSKEIELNMGLRHGFLYKPYKEWVTPAIQWAKENRKVILKHR